ncbi:MAG: Sec-independent protein translocase protein TatB [Legionellaceae bacterium]
MISLGEILLTASIAIIVLGPKRIPNAIHQLGKLIRHFNTLREILKQDFAQYTKKLALEENIQRAKAATEEQMNKTSNE